MFTGIFKNDIPLNYISRFIVNLTTSCQKYESKLTKIT